MYFFILLLFLEISPFIQASPIPDQVFDEKMGLCLSRRELSGIFDNSGTTPEDSLFAYFDSEPLQYEPFHPVQGSDLSNEGLEGDLGFLSDDIAALPLDTAPKDSDSRRKGACPAYGNSLPSDFGVLSPIPANLFIPSCESAYPVTLCCRGIPVPVPSGSANLGSEVLALPALVNVDGDVHVGQCIICEFLLAPFEYHASLRVEIDSFPEEICQSQTTTFCCKYYRVGFFPLITDMLWGCWTATNNNMITGRRRTPMQAKSSITFAYLGWARRACETLFTRQSKSDGGQGQPARSVAPSPTSPPSTSSSSLQMMTARLLACLLDVCYYQAV